MPVSEVHNLDCLEAMRLMPDTAFDLAIVDPPYKVTDPRGFGRGKTINGRHIVRAFSGYQLKTWDKETPSPIYFQELLRVSRHCIIWGANYFIENIPNANSPCWLVWFKNGQSGGTVTADCELAWATFSTSVRQFRYDWTGFGHINAKEPRIHPTQKPVALYKWLLTNYAKAGDRILDTHLGSQSSRIAAYDLGFDFVGYETDIDYFNSGNERFERHLSQPKLFEIVQPKETQETLFN